MFAGTAAAFREYLKAFPAGTHAAQAQQRLAVPGSHPHPQRLRAPEVLTESGRP